MEKSGLKTPHVWITIRLALLGLLIGEIYRVGWWESLSSDQMSSHATNDHNQTLRRFDLTSSGPAQMVLIYIENAAPSRVLSVVELWPFLSWPLELKSNSMNKWRLLLLLHIKKKQKRKAWQKERTTLSWQIDSATSMHDILLDYSVSLNHSQRRAGLTRMHKVENRYTGCLEVTWVTFSPIEVRLWNKVWAGNGTSQVVCNLVVPLMKGNNKYDYFFFKFKNYHQS